MSPDDDVIIIIIITIIIIIVVVVDDSNIIISIIIIMGNVVSSVLQSWPILGTEIMISQPLLLQFVPSFFFKSVFSNTKLLEYPFNTELILYSFSFT